MTPLSEIAAQLETWERIAAEVESPELETIREIGRTSRRLLCGTALNRLLENNDGEAAAMCVGLAEGGARLMRCLIESPFDPLIRLAAEPFVRRNIQ